MKKILKSLIAIALTFTLLFSLCSCSMIAATTAIIAKRNVNVPEMQTVIDEQNGISAVIGEDGNIVRDEAGNIIAYVTDVDGNYEKDENGEFATTPVAPEHPIVVGRRIEGPTYALNIPDGWSNKLTAADLDIIRGGTKDNIRLTVVKDDTLEETVEQRTSVINIAKNNFPSAESNSRTLTLANNISAQYMYVWIEDTGMREDDGNGNLNAISSFAGFIVFEYKGDVYACGLTSDTNMNEDINEIISILNSIEFIK